MGYPKYANRRSEREFDLIGEKARLGKRIVQSRLLLLDEILKECERVLGANGEPNAQREKLLAHTGKNTKTKCKKQGGKTQ